MQCFVRFLLACCHSPSAAPSGLGPAVSRDLCVSPCDAAALAGVTPKLNDVHEAAPEPTSSCAASASPLSPSWSHAPPSAAPSGLGPAVSRDLCVSPSDAAALTDAASSPLHAEQWWDWRWGVWRPLSDDSAIALRRTSLRRAAARPSLASPPSVADTASGDETAARALDAIGAEADIVPQSSALLCPGTCS